MRTKNHSEKRFLMWNYNIVCVKLLTDIGKLVYIDCVYCIILLYLMLHSQTKYYRYY